MSKVIDLRLRKIERAMKAAPYDDLSDEQLNALIRADLEVAAQPYNGNLVTMRDCLAASADHGDREMAKHIDHIIENFHEFYPQAAEPHPHARARTADKIRPALPLSANIISGSARPTDPPHPLNSVDCFQSPAPIRVGYHHPGQPS
ncbi:hypothetical protein [Methylobacterium thuringiense]|uniref:Uncharacterized protein n=1 Tax=Methylobacterium thuringiense TaxID=1003091 RepID=A0ABQ4TSV1_9HYPH|nr:hypothetical protein [Methylobacterium thuringiense]GJE56955.1 hypothetical protein EKPJFOCH_3465 [Methylobacterium thuringiense]